MSEMIKDERHRATGWPAVFIGVLLLLALIVTWRAIIGVTDAIAGGYPLLALTTILAAAIWDLAAIGTAHNGRRMRRIAGVGWAINIALPILGALIPDLFQPANPWYQAGASYFYVTTIAAVLGAVWLIYSRPAFIATRNG